MSQIVKLMEFCAVEPLKISQPQRQHPGYSGLVGVISASAHSVTTLEDYQPEYVAPGTCQRLPTI